MKHIREIMTYPQLMKAHNFLWVIKNGEGLITLKACPLGAIAGTLLQAVSHKP
ncbi:hypothetical protein [Thermotalea metallivorans]|uniref:hypothetical protein n=1 Tax=Thermotalea metallivorans TaxID=520762 RepID=UPI0012ED66CC|nr:hypothetical protein [Thermotalea metallivorans]